MRETEHPNFEVEDLVVVDEVKYIILCEYRGLGQIFDMPEMWLHLLSNMPPGYTDSACDSSGPLPGLHVQLCLHAGHD